MLDEFSSTKISPPSDKVGGASSQVADKHFQSGESQTASKATSDAEGRATIDDDSEFAKQLKAGMSEMMRELDSNPDMAKQLEEMMMDQFDAPSGKMPNINQTRAVEAKVSPSAAHEPSAEGEKSTTGGATFQDSIRRTMDRMRESNESASAASAAPENSMDEDFMTQMLNDITQANGAADGNPEEAFSNMLLGIMEQLTNKEILYEPMKELDSKFPDWLAEREPGKAKGNTITDLDREKYTNQQELVHEIVQRFERVGYSDQNTEDREFIVERMQKMQAAGAPPSELVGDMGAASEMLVGAS